MHCVSTGVFSATHSVQSSYFFSPGYEKYSLIQSDPQLCFLAKCGMPDNKALLAEQNDLDLK